MGRMRRDEPVRPRKVVGWPALTSVVSVKPGGTFSPSRDICVDLVRRHVSFLALRHVAKRGPTIFWRC